MLLEFSEILIRSVGYDLAISLAVVPLLLAILVALFRRKIDLVSITMLFSGLPAIAPLAASWSGFDTFTMLNHDLQTPDLKLSAALLVCLFTLFIFIGGGIDQKIEARRSIGISANASMGLAFATFILSVLFLESGNIITASYASFKLNDTVSYSSIVNQLFNLVAAFLFATAATHRKRRIVLLLLIGMAILCLVTSRRTLFIGVIILIFFLKWHGQMRTKSLTISMIGILLLIIAGEVRSVGLLNYFSGVQAIAPTIESHSLPGGASNIFVGTIGVIHLNLLGDLLPGDRFPVLGWAFGRLESTIYEGYGYAYNGGMHLAAILYWNVGLVGVIVGGSFIGWMARYSHIQLENWELGGLPVALSAIFCLLLTNIVWYHPIGFIKALIAMTLFHFILVSLSLRFRAEPKIIQSR